MPGRECSINGRTGVCTYSMMCTFAGGTHLGTCRDRFIFGSCCRLPPVEDQTGESGIFVSSSDFFLYIEF